MARADALCQAVGRSGDDERSENDATRETLICPSTTELIDIAPGDDRMRFDLTRIEAEVQAQAQAPPQEQAQAQAQSQALTLALEVRRYTILALEASQETVLALEVRQ